MNIEDFRAYCLSLPGVYDRFPFQHATSAYDRGLLVFYVLDKWFCMVNVDVFDFCTMKCAPEVVEALQDRYEAARPAYHMNKKHWVSVCFGQDVSDRQLQQLLRQSYEQVVASLPRRRQAELARLTPSPHEP